MLPYSSKISRYALVVFFLAVAVYGYFEARGILFGPEISVATAPIEVHVPFIRIEGHVKHIDDLRMNGASIPVTETGAFNEPYLLAPGLNRITLEAKDKYGHKMVKTVEIVYTPPPGAASTTAAYEATSTAHTIPPATHARRAVAR